MFKPLIIALSLTTALSLMPAASAAAAPISLVAYETLYTEANWQTLRVPLSELGNTMPSDLTLSAANLPTGTTITLTGMTQEGEDAVLTVDVERADTDTYINATSLITLNSGSTPLVTLSVPVMGVAHSY
jgi:hypothetical protein